MMEEHVYFLPSGQLRGNVQAYKIVASDLRRSTLKQRLPNFVEDRPGRRFRHA